ncbi:hypothetical protein V4C53_45570 [Paraburkholderia azotifigens]|uniref:hypothetical protein n=1 Tax=Paraburkholderia azotifigens TaxID=2057004 RepID=UPI003178261F
MSRELRLELPAILRSKGVRSGATSRRIRRPVVDAFEDAHIKANLEGPVEVPMKYFTASVAAALLLGSSRDSETLKFDTLFWSEMVEQSRYVLGQKAGSPVLSAITPR